MLSDYQLRQPTQCHLWQSERLQAQDVDDALQLVETWVDESHHSKHLCRCKRCGQLYVDVWCELIDWDDGDDQAYTFYIPVESEADIEQVKSAAPPPMSLDLMGFFPRINEDRRDGTRNLVWIGKSETFSETYKERHMRAYQLPKGGAGIEGLVKIERPEPKPAYRQVLVKVGACSLNFRDLGIVRGTYRMPVRENIVPLSDGAGEVVEVGPGVTRLKVGDRVAGCFFQRWFGGEAPPDVQAGALGGSIDGMLAAYAVLEEDGAVRIPPQFSLEEGATLPCAAVTAWHAMMEHAKLIAGQIVLLQGTGGVSIFGLQFAKAMGIQAIITSSSDEKLARAKVLGAVAGINYKTTPDWEKAVLEFTGGRGVDHVVEVGGAATLTRSFGAIRVGGKISMIGGLSGAATEFNPSLILGRRANMQGISVGSTQMFTAMVRAIEANAIKPVIDKVFAFDDAQAAYQHMASGSHFGKIVIRVG